MGTDRAIYNDYYTWASIAVAAACLLALFIRGSIFAARIMTNVRQGNHWCGPKLGCKPRHHPCVSSESRDVQFYQWSSAWLISPACLPPCQPRVELQTPHKQGRVVCRPVTAVWPTHNLTSV